MSPSSNGEYSSPSPPPINPATGLPPLRPPNCNRIFNPANVCRPSCMYCEVQQLVQEAARAKIDLSTSKEEGELSPNGNDPTQQDSGLDDDSSSSSSSSSSSDEKPLVGDGPPDSPDVQKASPAAGGVPEETGNGVAHRRRRRGPRGTLAERRERARLRHHGERTPTPEVPSTPESPDRDPLEAGPERGPSRRSPSLEVIKQEPESPGWGGYSPGLPSP